MLTVCQFEYPIVLKAPSSARDIYKYGSANNPYTIKDLSTETDVN